MSNKSGAASGAEVVVVGFSSSMPFAALTDDHRRSSTLNAATNLNLLPAHRC